MSDFYTMDRRREFEGVPDEMERKTIVDVSQLLNKINERALSRGAKFSMFVNGKPWTKPYHPTHHLEDDPMKN